MKILIAGDYCPRGRVRSFFDKNDYSYVLSDVKNIIDKVDYSIVNFECPVVSADAKPIPKLGPNLHCSLSGAEAIKWVGFDCVTLANNHFYDYGKDGVEQSINAFDSLGVDHIGGGLNLNDASKILYKEISGKKLAIINCCEHEFSIASDTTAGSNPLNPIQQYYSIREARKNADFVLVIVHGGHELFQLPSLRMVETYRFFIDAGADAVVNHHQHCYSGYEIWKGKPIFYGIGNFLFDGFKQIKSIWNEGYFVVIDFSSDNTTFSYHPYIQCLSEPNVKLLNLDAFDNKLHELNSIISNTKELKSTLDNYYTSQSGTYSQIFEPLRNRYYLYAKKRGWLPSLIGKKQLISAKNYIICESHRDKLIHWLSMN